MSMSRLQRCVSKSLGLRTMAISPFSQTIVAAATDVTLAPNAKKFPRSGFSVFQQDPKVHAKLKIGTDLAANSKAFSAEWKKMSEAEKAKYKAQQEKLKAEFEAKPQAPPKQKRSGPVTKYAKYVKDNYSAVKKTLPSDAKSPEVFKAVAKQWATLSDADKAKY